jgi:hypothetical protein
LAVSYSVKTYTFYTRSTAYKNKGALDQRSTHLLLLSVRSSPHEKARGSIGMCSKFIILLIKFSKVFTAE